MVASGQGAAQGGAVLLVLGGALGLLLLYAAAICVGRHRRMVRAEAMEEEKSSKRLLMCTGIERIAAANAKDGGGPRAPEADPGDIVALVTGANAGIGLALAHKLLAGGVRVVLGCRSEARAAAALRELQAAHPGEAAERVHVLRIDVSDARSIIEASAEFRRRFGRLNLLYLNAGVSPTAGLYWRSLALVACGCSWARAVHFMETGRATKETQHFMMQPRDLLVDDAAAAAGEPKIGLLFATHVLGHFLLLRELKPLLEEAAARGAEYAGDMRGKGFNASAPGGGYPAIGGRVIWTGSRSATRSVFTWADPQHLHGSDSYGNAKYCTDLLNVALGDRRRAAGVVNAVVCPGAVVSGVVPGFWRYLAPAMTYARSVFPFQNITTERGARVLARLAVEDQERLDTRFKYVLAYGKLKQAVNGYDPCPAGDAERLLTFVSRLADDWCARVGVRPTITVLET